MSFKSIILLFVLGLVLIQCSTSEDPKPPSIIIDISPKSGQPETSVTITGSNFSATPAKNEVTFNGVKATVVQATSTQLIVTAPEGTSSGVIEVTINNQKTTGPEFKYYHVYCYGAKYPYTAAYWMDGEATVLPTRGRIHDLAVSGQDVYAVGVYENPNALLIPTYWKNGVSVPLTGLNDLTDLTGIAVSGSDVYICGTDRSSGYTSTKAKYWKNGEVIFASDGSAPATATDIAISGNDVYLIGDEYPDAMLWKNGVGTPLSEGSIHKARRIRIIGTDVHIIGYQDLSISSTVKYWKNGNLAELKVGGLTGNGMDFAIHNSDVYVCGYKYESSGGYGYNIAKLWKNGDETSLSTPGPDRYGASIEVTDDAAYVLTNQFGTSYLRPFDPKLFKNGIDITPDYGPGVTGAINGMFIQYY